MRCHRSRKRRPCRSDGRTRFPQHDRSRGFDGRGVRTAAAVPARPPGGGGGPGERLGRAAASSPKSIWARTAPSSHACWRRSASHRAGPAGRARSLRASRLTSRTATGPAASTCDIEASGTPVRGSQTARPPAYAKAHAAHGPPASTKSGTRSAIPSSNQSTQARTSSRHPLRQARLRLPRHRHPRSHRHLAPHVIAGQVLGDHCNLRRAVALFPVIEVDRGLNRRIADEVADGRQPAAASRSGIRTTPDRSNRCFPAAGIR